jgi:hypothetical protein
MGRADTYARYAAQCDPTDPGLEERCFGGGPADVQDEIVLRQQRKEARAPVLLSSSLAPFPSSSTSQIQGAAAAGAVGADDDHSRWMLQMSTARGWHGGRTQSGSVREDLSQILDLGWNWSWLSTRLTRMRTTLRAHGTHTSTRCLRHCAACACFSFSSLCDTK